MIKRIYVVPLNFMVRTIINEKNPFNNEPWILVSISDDKPLVNSENYRNLLKEAGCSNILNMTFADVTKEKYLKFPRDLKEKLTLFGEEHAKKFLEFVKKEHETPDEKLLIIQCTAGISRSGALGIFACRWLNLDEKQFKKDNVNILPNPYILKFLMKKVNLNPKNYKSWWLDITITADNIF